MFKNSIIRNYKCVSQCRKTQLAWYFVLPTTDGNTARGASSSANPALHIPEPLSMTIAVAFLSLMFSVLEYWNSWITHNYLLTINLASTPKYFTDNRKLPPCQSSSTQLDTAKRTSISTICSTYSSAQPNCNIWYMQFIKWQYSKGKLGNKGQSQLNLMVSCYKEWFKENGNIMEGDNICRYDKIYSWLWVIFINSLFNPYRTNVENRASS